MRLDHHSGVTGDAQSAAHPGWQIAIGLFSARCDLAEAAPRNI